MRSDLSFSKEETFWFPGRWLGGSALVLAPILLLVGELLRAQYHFFFPDQLKAFKEYPEQIAYSYNIFLAGNILLWPAILTIVHCVGKT